MELRRIGISQCGAPSPVSVPYWKVLEISHQNKLLIN